MSDRCNPERFLEALHRHGWTCVQRPPTSEQTRAALSELAQDASLSPEGVAEQLVEREVGVLNWPPIVGVQVLLQMLDQRSTPARLLGTALDYLALYFQELDETVAACRSTLETDGEEGLELVRAALLDKIPELFSRY